MKKTYSRTADGIAAALFFILGLWIAQAEAEDRFIGELKLTNGKFAVVAEGDLEPRSVGSYSVRFYSADNPAFPYDNFLAGTVTSRSGVVERLQSIDLNGDGDRELVVHIRTVGSGGYVSAAAFSLRDTEVSLIASVDDIQREANIIEKLREQAAQ